MSDEIKIFWAFLATCPVMALAITLLAAMDGGTLNDEKDAFVLWIMLTGIFAIVVLAAGGMYFVWTWAL